MAAEGLRGWWFPAETMAGCSLHLAFCQGLGAPSCTLTLFPCQSSKMSKWPCFCTMGDNVAE